MTISTLSSNTWRRISTSGSNPAIATFPSKIFVELHIKEKILKNWPKYFFENLATIFFENFFEKSAKIFFEFFLLNRPKYFLKVFFNYFSNFPKSFERSALHAQTRFFSSWYQAGKFAANGSELGEIGRFWPGSRNSLQGTRMLINYRLCHVEW